MSNETRDKTEKFDKDALLSGAYSISDTDDARAFYKLWAEDYDDHMVEELGYCSPRLAAEQLMAHLADTDSEVLDVGCGTGLTSRPLFHRGFRNIDGIDISADMIEKARASGMFRNLYQADLNEPLDLAAESYDALVSSGTFTHGHVGPEPLGDLFGLLRKGGLFAFTVHEDTWEAQGFEARLAAMEKDGTIETVERRHDRFFEPLPPCGWFVLCRRL